MRFPFFVLTLLAVAVSAVAQASELPAVETLPDGVRLHLTAGGTVQVEVFAEKIFHVTAQPEGAPALQPSFVVTAHGEPVPFQVSTDSGEVTVSTKQVQARIDRATGRVSFFDPQGNTILAEQARKFTPAVVNKENTWVVEQSYGCAANESLFGLGQFQDGYWDWRGRPLQFQQVNSEIMLPFLLSSQGYGVLWDNASLTDFNPVDREIQLGTPPSAGGAGGPAPKNNDKRAAHTGSFLTGPAGRYVFIAKNGNFNKEFGIGLDGKPLIDLRNYWVPGCVTAMADLPAHTKVQVTVLGGGPGPHVFAAPWDPSRSTFRSTVGDGVSYWFFYGPELDDVIAGYRQATGAAPLFPEWAYGFWQCRERYSSQKQIVDAIGEFRKRQIPVDLVVQDWRYWGEHGWGAAAWDEKNYPDPKAMIAQLHQMNCKYMISIWPNPAGELGDALKAIDAVLPSSPDLYDATNPAARDLRWQYLKRAFFDLGTDAWWQDSDEPMDHALASLSGVQLHAGSGDRYLNAYPLFHNQGVYENQRAVNPAKRVVILSRSAYPGQQRYGAAVWSGDIAGTWDSLRRQIPAGLNFCLAGQPYWTMDCGGFFRPRGQYTSPDFNELQTRWYEFSTFCPILRMHGGGTATETWSWLPATQKNLLAYDEFRHRLLPYTYSVAWQVTHAGSTMMRALPLDFRTDAKACAVPDQYMFGPAFLVSPVDQPAATSRSVYLPSGSTWTDFWTGAGQNGGTTITAAAPPEQIPLFMRAGSILPLGPVVQYAGEKPADPIELRIYPGADGAFTLYEDEGDGYDYEHGAYAEIPLAWKEATRTLTIGDRKGSFPGMLGKRTFRVVWVRPQHGVGMEPSDPADAVVAYDGKSVSVQAPAAP